MLIIIPIIVVALGLGIHMFRRKQDRKRAVFTEELTAWFLFAFVGLMGLFSFAGHAFVADQTADSIGFPAGNPFQFEVAVTNLAFGVLGLLCLRYRGLFWWATGRHHHAAGGIRADHCQRPGAAGEETVGER